MLELFSKYEGHLEPMPLWQQQSYKSGRAFRVGPGPGLSLSKWLGQFRACIQKIFVTTETFVASYCWSNQVD